MVAKADSLKFTIPCLSEYRRFLLYPLLVLISLMAFSLQRHNSIVEFRATVGVFCPFFSLWGRVFFSPYCAILKREKEKVFIL